MLQRLGNFDWHDVLDVVPPLHDQVELACDEADLHGRNDIAKTGFWRNLALTDRGVRGPHGSVVLEQHSGGAHLAYWQTESSAGHWAKSEKSDVDLADFPQGQRRIPSDENDRVIENMFREDQDDAVLGAVGFSEDYGNVAPGARVLKRPHNGVAKVRVDRTQCSRDDRDLRRPVSAEFLKLHRSLGRRECSVERAGCQLRL